MSLSLSFPTCTIGPSFIETLAVDLRTKRECKVASAASVGLSRTLGPEAPRSWPGHPDFCLGLLEQQGHGQGLQSEVPARDGAKPWGWLHTLQTC